MTDLARYLADPVQLVAELVLENGRRYGDCWEGWQREFFEAVFARDGDRPRHRLIYSERRRGESKTMDAAAAAVTDLLTGPPRHHSYAVAADQDQAGLILDSVRDFVFRTPLLADLEVGRLVVRNPVTGSELRVMSADDRTSWGIRPRLVISDELSLQPDDRLWKSMWTAIGKRPDAQLVALSMAGWDVTSICWQVREQAARMPRSWLQTREDSEPAPWLDPQAMEEQRESLHPLDFARYWEARWVEAAGSWLSRELYDPCVTGLEAFSGDGSSEYVGGVDIGLVHDPTVIAVVHGADDVVVLDTLRTLQGSRSAPLELAAVEELVEQLTAQYGVRRWRFEAPQAAASVQRLQERLGFSTVEIRFPTAITQGALFGSLYELFRRKSLVLYPHDQLRREALNLVIKTTAGRFRVVDSGVVHQDHVIALGIAAELLTANPWAEGDRLIRMLARAEGVFGEGGMYEKLPDNLYCRCGEELPTEDTPESCPACTRPTRMWAAVRVN